MFIRKPAIWLISKKIFSWIFIKCSFQKWESAFHYGAGFSIFLVIFSNDIFWNRWISIWKIVSTFPLWQFSRSSFFAQKFITKKLILEFLFGTPHLVGYGSQKEFPFDRCTYRGSLFLHFFRKFQISCVSKNPIKYASSGIVFGSHFSIFFGSWQWFSPSWC